MSKKDFPGLNLTGGPNLVDNEELLSAEPSTRGEHGESLTTNSALQLPSSVETITVGSFTWPLYPDPLRTNLIPPTPTVAPLRTNLIPPRLVAPTARLPTIPPRPEHDESSTRSRTSQPTRVAPLCTNLIPPRLVAPNAHLPTIPPRPEHEESSSRSRTSQPTRVAPLRTNLIPPRLVVSSTRSRTSQPTRVAPLATNLIPPRLVAPTAPLPIIPPRLEHRESSTSQPLSNPAQTWHPYPTPYPTIWGPVDHLPVPGPTWRPVIVWQPQTSWYQMHPEGLWYPETIWYGYEDLYPIYAHTSAP